MRALRRPSFLRPARVPPWLYRISAGSCNGCDVEVVTLASVPSQEIDRLGCRFSSNSGQADIVLITGALTASVKDRVLTRYEEIPSPKVTVAIGACPISGGIFRGSEVATDPLDQCIPVDINVPGCPPRPQAILEGIARAVDVWRTRT